MDLARSWRRSAPRFPCIGVVIQDERDIQQRAQSCSQRENECVAVDCRGLLVIPAVFPRVPGSNWRLGALNWYEFSFWEDIAVIFGGEIEICRETF